MTNAFYFLAGLLVASVPLGLWIWRLEADTADMREQIRQYRSKRHVPLRQPDLRAEVEAIRDQVEDPLGGVGGRDPNSKTRERTE